MVRREGVRRMQGCWYIGGFGSSVGEVVVLVLLLLLLLLLLVVDGGTIKGVDWVVG